MTVSYALTGSQLRDAAQQTLLWGAVGWVCYCFLPLRDGTSWLSSPRILYLEVQASAHSSAQTVGIREEDRPCAGHCFPHSAGSSPSWPPTGPCQAASYGCFKTFSIKCVVGRAWSWVAGDVPVPTPTLDRVVSHVPAAFPAKLLWAILEHIQNAWEVP